MSVPPQGPVPPEEPAGQTPPVPPSGTNPPPAAPDPAQQWYESPYDPSAAPPPGPQQPAGGWSGVAGGAAQSWVSEVSQVGDAGFFKALFDFSFSKFITTRILGVLFGVLTVLVALAYVVFVIASFVRSPLYGFVVLVFGAVVALVYIVLIRVTLELYAAVVRTAQNTGVLVERQR